MIELSRMRAIPWRPERSFHLCVFTASTGGRSVFVARRIVAQEFRGQSIMSLRLAHERWKVEVEHDYHKS